MAIDDEITRPRHAPSESDGRRRILDVTRRRLETGSEASLRLTDIAQEADVAIGLIGHHFGNRDGLVAVAQAEIYEDIVRRDLVAIEDAIETARDREDLGRKMADLTRRILTRGPAAHRLARTAAIGAAHGRPELRQTLAVITTGLIDDTAQLIGAAQDRGLARRDLSARAIATFMLSYVFGLVLAELDAEPVDSVDLAAVIDLACFALIGTEPQFPSPTGSSKA